MIYISPDLGTFFFLLFFCRNFFKDPKWGPFPGPRAGVRVAAVTPGEYLPAREPKDKDTIRKTALTDLVCGGSRDDVRLGHDLML